MDMLPDLEDDPIVLFVGALDEAFVLETRSPSISGGMDSPTVMGVELSYALLFGEGGEGELECRFGCKGPDGDTLSLVRHLRGGILERLVRHLGVSSWIGGGEGG
jgi:hypothetical protein